MEWDAGLFLRSVVAFFTVLDQEKDCHVFFFLRSRLLRKFMILQHVVVVLFPRLFSVKKSNQIANDIVLTMRHDEDVGNSAGL